MKTILRNIVFYSFAIFALTEFLPGVKILGGLPTYIFAGFVLSLMFLIVKPVLNLITLPLNIITLGTFSFVINVIILYLLTLFVPNIEITSFTFPGFVYSGFIIPKIYFNLVLSYIASGLVLSIIVTFLTWLIKK